MTRRSVDERFASKYTLDGECWVWHGAKVGGGYGSFSIGGRNDANRTQAAHRWSYERHVGPIPDGLELDHLCRRPACVNPAHLEAVTPAENSRRRYNSADSAEWLCKSGRHSLDDPANVYVAPDGGRRCRACHREAVARHAAKRKGA